MPDLADIHQALVDDYRESFEIAAAKLLAQPSWTLEATVVLMHVHSGGVAIGPVRSLPLWLDHLSPDLDDFVRLQEQGVPFEEAYAQCLAEQALGHPRQPGRAHRHLPEGQPGSPESCWRWPNGPTTSAASWCHASS